MGNYQVLLVVLLVLQANYMPESSASKYVQLYRSRDYIGDRVSLQLHSRCQKLTLNYYRGGFMSLAMIGTACVKLCKDDGCKRANCHFFRHDHPYLSNVHPVNTSFVIKAWQSC